jgi:hypothetical protein
MPLNNYIGGAQQILSKRLGMPVTISGLRYSLVRQELVLERVGIGKLGEIKVDSIKVSALPTALLGENKSFSEAEAIAVVADQDSLALVPEWLKPQAGALPLHVKRIKLKAVRLSVKAMDLAPFDADVTLGADGGLQRALLSDGKVRIDITPKDNALRLTLEARSWKPPFGSLPVEFDDLALEAVVEAKQATITNIDGKLGFSPIKGSAKVSWGSGAIRVEGDYSLTNGDLSKLMPAFTHDFIALGQLAVNATYSFQGTSLENLFADPKLTATFNIDRGSLNNVDVVRAIQSPSRDGLRGGKTSFNTLAGSVQLANKTYAFRQLQLASGPMSASGNVEVGANGDLSGRVSAEVGSKTVIVAKGTLIVTGNIRTPVLKQ